MTTLMVRSDLIEVAGHPSTVRSFAREGQALDRLWVEAATPERPSMSSRRGVSERFFALAEEWRERTAFISSSSARYLDRAYQQIIGLGEPAVPFLLRELRDRPNHWSWALRSITGVDPVPPSMRGNLQATADAWLEWGKGRGYNV